MLKQLAERLVVTLSSDASEHDAQRERRAVLDELAPTAPLVWRRFLERHAPRVQRGGVPTLLALAEAEPATSEIGAAARAHLAQYPVARPALVAATRCVRDACVRTLEPLPRVVLECAHLAPGESVVYAAGYGALHRFDLVTGEVRSSEPVDDANPRWLVATAGGPIITASDDGAIHHWDHEMLTAKKAGQVRGEIVGLALSPDGNQLAIATEDGLQLADPNGRNPRTLIHEACAGAPAFDASGARIAMVTLDGGVRVADVASGKAGRTLATSSPIEAVAFHPDGRLLASSEDGVEVWDASAGKRIATLTAPRHGARSVSGVDHIAIAADGRTVITGGASDDILVWDLERGAAHGTLVTGTLDALGLFLLRDGRVVTLEHDGARLWDLAALDVMPPPRRTIGGITFVDDTRLLVSDTREVRLHAASDLAVIARVEAPPLLGGLDRVAVTVAPDRRHVAIWAGDELVVRDTASLAETWRFSTRSDEEYDEDSYEDRSILDVAFEGPHLAITTAHERRARVVRVDGTPVATRTASPTGDLEERAHHMPLDRTRTLAWEHDVLSLHDTRAGDERARWVAAAPIHDLAVAPSAALVALATTVGSLELVRWHAGPPALVVRRAAPAPDEIDDAEPDDEIDEMFAADMKGLPADGVERLRALIACAADALPLQEEEYLAAALALANELRDRVPADLQRELGIALVETADDVLAKKGVALLRQAVDAGSVEALFDLGLELFHGDYVKAKPNEGFALLARAAERDHGGAAAELAVIYKDGLSVPKDAKLAKQWYDRATQAGHDWADDERW
jgi:hypothetical protein